MTQAVIRGVAIDDNVPGNLGYPVKMSPKAGMGTLILEWEINDDSIIPTMQQAPTPTGPWVTCPSSTLPSELPVDQSGWGFFTFTYSQPYVRLSPEFFSAGSDFLYGVILQTGVPFQAAP